MHFSHSETLWNSKYITEGLRLLENNILQLRWFKTGLVVKSYNYFRLHHESDCLCRGSLLCLNEPVIQAVLLFTQQHGYSRWTQDIRIMVHLYRYLFIHPLHLFPALTLLSRSSTLICPRSKWVFPFFFLVVRSVAATWLLPGSGSAAESSLWFPSFCLFLAPSSASSQSPDARPKKKKLLLFCACSCNSDLFICCIM